MKDSTARYEVSFKSKSESPSQASQSIAIVEAKTENTVDLPQRRPPALNVIIDRT